MDVRTRPILFSGVMVRSLIAGTKTQTRRIVKGDKPGQPLDWLDAAGFDPAFVADPANHLCPYGIPGDLLWVRESIHQPTAGGFIYRANWREQAKADGYDNIPDDESATRWTPSIHMPRVASRLTLEITDVRVERLQDISEADAIAEGLYRSKPDDEDREWFGSWHEENTGEPPTQADWDQFNQGVWMVPGVPQGWGMTKEERQRDTWGPTPQFCYRLLWEHINGKASWEANPWVWCVGFRCINKNVDEVINV